MVFIYLLYFHMVHVHVYFLSLYIEMVVSLLTVVRILVLKIILAFRRSSNKMFDWNREATFIFLVCLQVTEELLQQFEASQREVPLYLSV